MQKLIQGIAESADGKQTPSDLLIHKDEGLKSALQAAGICWAIAVLSIFIPLAHFVLVPGFFVAGIFVFFWKKKNRFSIEEAKGKCPHCAQDFKLKHQPFRFPIEVYCDLCRKEFKLRPLDAASLEHL